MCFFEEKLGLLTSAAGLDWVEVHHRNFKILRNRPCHLSSGSTYMTSSLDQIRVEKNLLIAQFRRKGVSLSETNGGELSTSPLNSLLLSLLLFTVLSSYRVCQRHGYGRGGHHDDS